MTILYITQNGITTPIGRSQVLPYLIKLSLKGYEFHLLSSEPDCDEENLKEMSDLLSFNNIRWTAVKYKNKPPIVGPLLTQYLLYRSAKSIINSRIINLIHCRSFPPAVIGYLLKRRYSIKYIFDFRDFYADWGLQFTYGIKKLLYYIFKRLEGPMILNADKVVCLTKKGQEILLNWYYSSNMFERRKFSVIPCCSDFEHYNVCNVDINLKTSIRKRVDIPDNFFVLLYLGTLGSDYLLDEMLVFFKVLLNKNPNSIFVFLSNNMHNEILKNCIKHELKISDIRVLNATWDEVPAYLSLANFSIIFYRPYFTQAGRSPIKISELFACNIPVIVNSGIGDLDDLISEEKNSSLVIPDFEVGTMSKYVDRMLDINAKGNINTRNSSHYLSLQAGCEAYSNVYQQLLN